MSSAKARIVLPKDALRQLAKLGMDPTVKKDPLNDASIVKWSTVVAPIATKALMENSANMKVEGKSEAEFRAGLSGAERAQREIRVVRHDVCIRVFIIVVFVVALSPPVLHFEWNSWVFAESERTNVETHRPVAKDRFAKGTPERPTMTTKAMPFLQNSFAETTAIESDENVKGAATP